MGLNLERKLQMRHLVLIVVLGFIGCNSNNTVQPQTRPTPKMSRTNATKPISAYWLNRYNLSTGIYDKENGIYSCKSKILTLANGTIQYKVVGNLYGNATELQIHVTVTSTGRSIQEIDYLIEILDSLNLQLRNKEVHFTITYISEQTITTLKTKDYQVAFNAAIKNYNNGKSFQLAIKINILGDKERN